MENAGRARTGPARNAGCLADGRTGEPSRHRIHHLAGAVSQVISRRVAHDLARPPSRLGKLSSEIFRLIHQIGFVIHGGAGADLTCPWLFSTGNSTWDLPSVNVL